MADDKPDSPRPFNVRTVEHLIRLMSDHDLHEIDLTEGDRRLRLRRGRPVPLAAPVAPAPAAVLPAAPPAPTQVSAPAAGKFHEIKDELVGTFYSRPAPDKPEFVKVGSRVTPETTVGLVIAMKVTSEIKAKVTGTIVEVCVKNEDYVDYNTVLFRVDTSS